MKIFISWSGQTSQNIAEIMRQWLPSVIQFVKPYYSPDDITKGTKWNSEISKELDESRVGILCLTKENLNSPWIMFEAGALSKNVDKSKVCPLLFGIEPSDIQGPLVQFQAAKFSKGEMKKVTKMINLELGENALSSEVFENVFEMWWPILNERIETEISNAKKTKKVDGDIREERDILEEILSLTRNISLIREKVNDRNSALHPDVVEDLISSFSEIVISMPSEVNEDIFLALNRIYKPIDYILKTSDISRNTNVTLSNLLEMSFVKIKQLKINAPTIEMIQASKLTGPKILGKISLPIDNDTRPRKHPRKGYS